MENGAMQRRLQYFLILWMAFGGLGTVSAAPVLFQDDDGGSKGPSEAEAACARSFVDAFNSGAERHLREFESAYRPNSERSLEERVRGIQSLQQRWGSLRYLGELEPSAEGPIGYVRAARRGEWLALTFLFVPGSQGELAGVRMEVTHGPRVRAALESEWKSLGELLLGLEPLGIAPAMAVAFVRGDRVIDVAAVGRRSVDDEGSRIDGNARFHVGSCGKPMTAMLVALLEGRNGFSSTATLQGLLPNQAADTAYAAVSIDQFLFHRSGLPPQNDFGDLLGLTGTPREQRIQALGHWLASTPTSPPGARMNYANAGYAIVGTALESTLDEPFEMLMERHLFIPLGLNSAGFGAAQGPDRPDGVVDHVPTPSGPTPNLPGRSSVPAALAPAGDIHMDIGDLGRFAQVHLEGLAGKDGLLPAERFRWLHSLPEEDTPEDEPTYARGWGISRGPDGVAVHSHVGSNGASFAQITLIPEHDLGVVILMNHMPTSEVQTLADALVQVARERHGKDGVAEHRGR